MCKVSRCNSTKLEEIQDRHHKQHATAYNSAKLEQIPVMVELGRCAHHLRSYVDCLPLLVLWILLGGWRSRICRDPSFQLLKRTAIIQCLTNFLPLYWFCIMRSDRQEKGIKCALQNSFMHDTDEHYSGERESHDTRMEYVRKTGRLDIFTPMMW